jgi:hypothetical protein
MPSPYIPRTFLLPSGFYFLPVNTNVYTDADINNLYLRFSACYSNRMYSIAKAKKMGCKEEMDCESKYLLMALYILRNWYNPNPYSFAQFSLQNIQSINALNIYTVPSNGSQLNTQQLDYASGYLSAYSAYIDLMNNANNYLLGQDGWGLTFTEPDSFIITAPSGYSGNNWIWINEIYYGETTVIVNQWMELQSINPCLSVEAIQNIIETCIGICGNPNCTNKATLLDDNNFIPLGQNFIPPSDILTNIFPNQYFL